MGRINLTYALTEHGTTRTEYTIVRLKQDEYYLISAGAWTAYDYDFLQKCADDWMAQGGGGIEIHDITTQWGVYALAGPNARALLKDIVKEPIQTVLGNKRFLWFPIGTSNWGMCPVRDRGPIPASWAGNCTIP